RDAFAVLFFVSVGMLFDPAILWQEPLRVLLVVLAIMLGKTLAAFALVRMLGYPLHSALTVSISLAQIGEFSFILVGLGSSLGLLPAQAQSLILAGAMLSIAFNPLLFALAEPWRKRALARAARGHTDTQPDPLSVLPDGTDPNRLQGHVVLLGYGDLGRALHLALAPKHATVIAEIDRDHVEALRAAGQAAVWGDAAEDAVLVQTHVARARALVLTFGDPLKAARIAEVARMLNPGVQLLACADSAEAARALREAGFDQVIEARACQVEAVRLALQAQARAD
ncbi:MAG: cation:proton antiporter, partial [Xanthomonadales bacterium]|nr:cation:proton antiporter [Xanthomonadales bacterium]